jgi:hypothetical protein
MSAKAPSNIFKLLKSNLFDSGGFLDFSNVVPPKIA